MFEYGTVFLQNCFQLITMRYRAVQTFVLAWITDKNSVNSFDIEASMYC